jgi:hypothetical protein
VKRVFQAHDVTEAHFVKGLLESHGLSALVRGEALAGLFGEVPRADTWPSVWVLDDAREEEARAIIKDYDTSIAKDATPVAGWKCPTCGQDLEPQFTSCWACGMERPPEAPAK